MLGLRLVLGNGYGSGYRLGYDNVLGNVLGYGLVLVYLLGLWYSLG